MPGHGKAESVGVKRRRHLDTADLEVDVTDGGSRRCTLPRPVVEQLESGEIEPVISHHNLVVVPAPRRTRPIRVYLDPVALGVRKIDGLADEMVCGAVDREVVLSRMPKPTAEVGAGGQQKRGVEEPGRVRVAGQEVRAVEQVQKLTPARAEPHRAGSRRYRVEADCVLIEAHDAAEIADGEGDGADLDRVGHTTRYEHEP